MGLPQTKHCLAKLKVRNWAAADEFERLLDRARELIAEGWQRNREAWDLYRRVMGIEHRRPKPATSKKSKKSAKAKGKTKAATATRVASGVGVRAPCQGGEQ
jgi:hypothetical protein